MLPEKSTISLNRHYSEVVKRWSKERAEEWSAHNGWIVGCNFITSNAINQLEMWQEDTFSPFLIDRELSLAAGLGFNTVRVFLHDLLWEQDPEGLLKRIDKFLSIGTKYNIRTMLVLFDGVWDPFPQLGKQRGRQLNVHNSGWVQSPGFNLLNDVAKHDGLRGYVQGVVTRFRCDERVLVWDVFNEPDNINYGSYNDDNYVINKGDLSLMLLRKATEWIREVDPIQPLTAAPWQWTNMGSLSPIDKFMFGSMDIISFHCYEDSSCLEKRILELRKLERPMLCTEYMARPLKSTFKHVLPFLKKYNVGAFNWGLVAGKTQTHCAWDSWVNKQDGEPETWFHDIFHSTRQPYDQQEVDFIKNITKRELKPALEHLEIA